jgi:hypothetical protein
MSTTQKIIVGASGGIALSILKLIQSDFFLDSNKPASIWGSYLTLVGYIILGALVGLYFCEESQDLNKTRKSAFLMGLLAPSILLAITTKPVETKDLNLGHADNVPNLGMMLDALVPSAYAQSPAPASPATGSSAIPIKVLEQKDSLTNFGEGVKSALGIQQPATEQAVFVVGKTGNPEVAQKTAGEINNLLSKQADTKLRATIIKPDAQDKYFVAIGDVTSPSNAVAIEREAKGTALKTLVESSTQKEKDTAKVLSAGDVVSRPSLFKE